MSSNWLNWKNSWKLSHRLSRASTSCLSQHKACLRVAYGMLGKEMLVTLEGQDQHTGQVQAGLRCACPVLLYDVCPFHRLCSGHTCLARPQAVPSVRPCLFLMPAFLVSGPQQMFVEWVDGVNIWVSCCHSFTFILWERCQVTKGLKQEPEEGEFPLRWPNVAGVGEMSENRLRGAWPIRAVTTRLPAGPAATPFLAVPTEH